MEDPGCRCSSGEHPRFERKPSEGASDLYFKAKVVEKNGKKRLPGAPLQQSAFHDLPLVCMKQGECAACSNTGVFKRGSSPKLGLEVDDKGDALIAAVIL